MSALWLFLYLGTLVHGLALYGFDGRSPAQLVLLAPLAALGLLPALRTRRATFFPPWSRRLAGLAALAFALAFLRLHYLDYWNTEHLGFALLVAGLGLAALWVTAADPQPEGPGTWIWIAAWLAAGFLDPLLPFLGAGVGACAAAFGLLPAAVAGPADAPARSRGFLSLALLGLVLPKPWWDWGLQPDGALPVAAFALGAALAHSAPARVRLAGLPTGLLHGGMALLFVLYWPTFGGAWGLLLGLLGGTTWLRLPEPRPLARLGTAFAAGLALSFALHANA